MQRSSWIRFIRSKTAKREALRANGGLSSFLGAAQDQDVSIGMPPGCCPDWQYLEITYASSLFGAAPVLFFDA